MLYEYHILEKDKLKEGKKSDQCFVRGFGMDENVDLQKTKRELSE